MESAVEPVPAVVSSPVGTSFVMVARGVTYLLGAFTSILVARILGPHDRGVWAVAVLVSGLVALVSEMGLGAAVFSLCRGDRERRRVIVTMGSVLAVATGGLCAGATILASARGALSFLPGVPHEDLTLALGGVGLANILSVGRYALLEDGDLIGGTFSQLTQAGSLLLLLGTLSIYGPSARTAIGLFVASLVLTTLYTVLRMLRRGLISVAWDRSLVAPLLTTGLVSHLGTLALFLSYRFDLLLVNYFLGPSAAGRYSVALTLSEALRGLPEVGQMVVLARSSSAEVFSVVRETGRLVILATALGGGVAALLGPWLIPVVLGKEFAGAATPFGVLVLGVLGLAVSYSISPVLLLQGRLSVSTAGAMLALLMMVSIDVLLIPRWGLVGAAVASSLAYWFLALFQLQGIGARLDLKDLAPRPADVRRLLAAARCAVHRVWGR